MNFGTAIELLKSGKKVSRQGWNGKGMYLELQVPDAHSKMTLPYIYMKTADNNLVPWLASQTDILSDDWQLLSNTINVKDASGEAAVLPGEDLGDALERVCGGVIVGGPSLRASIEHAPWKRSGGNGMRYGDRVIYNINGKHGVAGEFTQDGDVFIKFDDGTCGTVKWNNCRKE